MSDAAKRDEFITKFSNVEFSVVLLENRPDPNALSPEMRSAYERIIAAIGSNYVGITEDGKFFVSDRSGACITEDGQFFVSGPSGVGTTENGKISVSNLFAQHSKPNRPFKVVPPEKRPDPNALPPERRIELYRLVAEIGSGFVGVTKNGDLYVIGTMTQHRKDGSTKPNEPFIALTAKTKNGTVLDHAGDMAENCSDPTAIYRAKATVVPGREDGKGGRFPNSLRLSFPEKEADFLARHASRTRSKDKAQQEIPF
jgi:hypothetical protein